MSNPEYSAMPDNYHIMWKFMVSLYPYDFYPVWITGKGNNIKGNVPDSPHYPVYNAIVNYGYQGVYQGDQARENQEVFNLASVAISEALQHEHFCCFIHFRDPDNTGHSVPSYSSYYYAAKIVDNHISQLMDLIPREVKVIYCSDHGFNFEELGEVETNHNYAPEGMMATNFPTSNISHITRQTIGRLIYKKMGGNPDSCLSGSDPYAMYGVDI
jgi:hypothetical protein